LLRDELRRRTGVSRASGSAVVAALTILRAYHVAGRPKMPTNPLGSFEIWSRWVRDALIWLGEPDPCKTMDRARAEDPRMQELGAVLSHWNTVIGQDAVTVKQLIERATESYATVPGGIDTNKREFMNPNFREALLIEELLPGGTIATRNPSSRPNVAVIALPNVLVHGNRKGAPSTPFDASELEWPSPKWPLSGVADEPPHARTKSTLQRIGATYPV